MILKYTLALISFLVLPYLFCGFKKSRYTKIIKFILFILLSIIICLQATSLIRMGLLIPPLALANLDQYRAVGDQSIYIFLLLFVLQLFLLFLASFIKIKKKPLIMIICVITILTPRSPIYEMGRSVKKAVSTNNVLYKYISMEQEIYASLQKSSVSENSTKETYVNPTRNIIVIFTEGMSYGVISKEVTPNIYQLQNSGLNVVNYFNHTAATYRGLRGQLSSSHQFTGGTTTVEVITGNNWLNYVNESVESLPEKLNNLGYTTYFQSSNGVNDNLSIMLKTLKFNYILGLENKKDSVKWSVNELTDKDSYELLFDSIQTAKQPFFYGMYTIETHAGLDSTDKKYKDGSNPLLNKFYNMDFHLGQFLEKFNNSKLSENTTIIFTTDHSSWPERDFISTFKTKSPTMIDTVPLIIYSKGASKKLLDAHGLNSLTLAPTILDILGYSQMDNRFIGRSLFDSRTHSKFECVAAVGLSYWSTCDGVLQEFNEGNTITDIQKLQSLGR